MSRRKRQIERQQKEREKQKVRAAKKARQQNYPSRWEEKKRRKCQSQVAYKDGKFPGINEACELNTFQLPSPENCKGCVLDCPYNK